MKPRMKKKNLLIPSAIIAVPFALLIAGVIHIIGHNTNLFKKDNLTLRANDNDEPDYLTLTNINDEGSSKVTFKYSSKTSISYRTYDATNTSYSKWNDYSETPTITLSNYGDSVQFKGENVTTDMNDNKHFYLEGKLAASGDVGTITNLVGGANVELSWLCYYDMFHECDALYDISELKLPATSLADQCYFGMFRGCSNLQSIPENFLPAETLTFECYAHMFRECKSINSIPDNCLSAASTLAEGSYVAMFYGCEGLTTVSENLLPAKKLAKNCYGRYDTYTESGITTEYFNGMFSNCKNLKNAPKLPATTLAESCYENMFYGCNSLTVAPELPATTMAKNCYKLMFHDCETFTEAPKLPATTLAEGCYMKMFDGCENLATVPELPATELKTSCYESMFSGCTSISTVPELPATILVSKCYKEMFKDCTNISEIPSMSIVTSVTSSCCDSMYSGCQRIYLYTTKPENIDVTEWIIGSGTTSSKSWNTNMFEGTNGGSPVVTSPSYATTYYIKKYSPVNIVEKQQNFTYGDSNIKFTATGKDGLSSLTGFTVKYKVNNNWTSDAPTNAGTYDVLVTRPIDETYNSFSKIITGGLKINKATYNMTNVTWNYSSSSPYTYTGEEQSVTLNTTGLPEGVSAKTYSDNAKTNVGTYTASVTAWNYDETNYEAPTIASCDWQINKATAVITTTQEDISRDYNGEIVTPANATSTFGTVTTTVYKGGTVYTGEIKDVGTYTITYSVEGTNNYNGATLSKTVTISKATYDMSNAKWDYTSAFTYDGSEKTVSVTDLPIGVKVNTYSSNSATAAGSYTASVTLSYDTTNYNAPSLNDLSWEISKATITKPTSSSTTYTYNGSAQKYFTTESNLLTYTNNTQTYAGSYKVGVALKDNSNYKWADGTQTDLEFDWTINKADYNMSGASWNYTSPFTYDGTTKTVSVTGLPSGVIVNTYSSNSATAAGSYTASVTLSYDTTNYNEPNISNLSWTINKAKITKPTESTSTYTFNGSEQKYFDITSDLLTYTNNSKTDAGTYEVVVSLNNKSNYVWEDDSITDLKFNWVINQKEIDEIHWGKDELYTGEEVTFVASYKDINGQDTALSLTFDKTPLIDAGKYTATAVAPTDTNYKLPSDTSKITHVFTIGTAEYDMSNAKWVYDSTTPFTYDGQEHSITVTGLPDGVAVKEYTLNKATNAGTYIAKVTFEYDPNYVKPELPDCQWVIAQKEVEITWGNDQVYNGQPISFNATYKDVNGNDVAIDLAYLEKEVKNAGVYHATALTLTDTNYVLPTDSSKLSHIFNILKAENKIIIESGEDSKTFDGNVVDIRNVTTASGEKPVITIEKAVYTNEIVDEIKNVGVYTITYSIAESDNYKGITASYVFTVNQAEIDNQIEPQSGNTGFIVKDQEGNEIKATVLYAKEGTDEWTSEVPTEVGKYDVKIVLDDANLKAKTDFISDGFEVKSNKLWLPYVISASTVIATGIGAGLVGYFYVNTKRKEKKKEQQ